MGRLYNERPFYNPKHADIRERYYWFEGLSYLKRYLEVDKSAKEVIKEVCRRDKETSAAIILKGLRIAKLKSYIF